MFHLNLMTTTFEIRDTAKPKRYSMAGGGGAGGMGANHLARNSSGTFRLRSLKSRKMENKPCYFPVIFLGSKVEAVRVQNLQTSIVQQKHNVSHICNLKFSSRHIKKGKIEVDITFSNIFYLTEYKQNIISSICNL